MPDRFHVLVMLLAILALAPACAKPAPQPEKTLTVTVVLLEKADGSVGKIAVQDEQGATQVLDRSGQAVLLAANQPAHTTRLSIKEIDELFHDALRIQPRPPARFLLYHNRQTSRLKAESRKLLAKIAREYEERGSTNVSVIGHIDGVGDSNYNMIASQRRAEQVASLLEELGIDPAHMIISFHGEANPLVPDKAGKSSPENRRVEVIVR